MQGPQERGAVGMAVGGPCLPGGACGLRMERGWLSSPALEVMRTNGPFHLQLETQEFGGEAVGRVSKVERVSIFIPILSCPHPSPISVALKREASSSFMKTRRGKRQSSSSWASHGTSKLGFFHL